jgi:ATP-binding cassette subfamily B protein
MKRSQGPQLFLPGVRRIFAYFWPYIRKHRLLLIGSVLALAAQVCLRCLEPWPLKFIFDQVLSGGKHRSRGPHIAALEGLEPTTLLAIAVGAIVVFAALRGVADYFNTVGFGLIGNRVLTEVRNLLYRHLQGLSLSYHTQSRSGDLVVRVISDVNLLKNVTVTSALPLVADICVLLVMIVVMLFMHWQLALLALMALPLFWFWTVGFTRRAKHAARSQREREGEMAATAAESIGAIKLVQALSLESLFTKTFILQNLESQKHDVKGIQLAAALSRSVHALVAAGTAVVLWFGARFVMRGELSAGELLVFLTYLKNAFRPVQEFAKYTARLAKATAAGERVIDVLEQTPEVRDLPGAVPAPAFRGAVRFEGVTFAYEPGRPVLEHIDFEVEAGQRVALVGPSGIGKSTLVSLMLRLYDPVQGRVLIDGHDLREYTLASVRSQISVVLQDTLLFGASVRDNIAYGAPDATPEAVEAAARLANAHEFIEALPQGYDTLLGERGVTLSGGQRQRIALARAAIRKAPFLILDEPTTGLDTDNACAVLEALERLAQDRTTFFITHDLQVVAGADLILYLERGRVVERGSHAELMEKNGRYATIYRRRTLPREPSDRLETPAGVN